MFKNGRLESLTSMSEIMGMSWKDFEWFTKFFLEKRGHHSVFVTKKHGALGGDGGVDVESFRDGKMNYTQCKRWNPSFRGTFKGLLPVRVIRELGGCMLRDNVQQGIIMTTLCYESLDLLEAKKMNIELIGRNEIIKAMKEMNPKFDRVSLKRFVYLPLWMLRWIFLLMMNVLFD